MNKESRIENQETAADSTPRQVNVVNSQVGVIGDYAQVGEIHFHIEPPANPRERRNRAAMLQLVRNTWIKGVLEQSLHGAALLELGMEYHPEAVDHPWDMVVQIPERPDKAVPPGTRIVDVFDELGGSLLILGEPGSGKTTMLLELARDLIARAEQDETLHIPVVFNLSSWAAKQPPLEEWLVEELCTKYYIPKKIAQTWVQEDTLLLLLDGLDEVKADTREKCIAALNTFRQKHLVLLTVCSRTTEYEALTTKLCLQGAIDLRPLTSAQIDAYLSGAGVELRTVRATFHRDPILQEMAQSPLFLSIMTLTYHDKSITDLQTFATPEARRRHLFDTYIVWMFQRRAKDTPYTPEKTRHWLSYLAQQMILHAQSLFLVENLQPTWLSPDAFHRARHLSWLLVGLYYGLILGSGFGLVLGLMWMREGQFCGLLVGLLVGLIVGLIIGLVVGLVEGLSKEIEVVEPVEIMKWSWRKACKGLSGRLLSGLAFGLAFGLLLGLINGAMGAGLSLGWVLGLIGGLVFGMVGGLEKGELAEKTIPNQGIRQSAKNILVSGLYIGLFVWIAIALLGIVAVLSSEWSVLDVVFIMVFGLLIGLITVPILGLVYGMNWGGRAVLLHFAIHFVLFRANLLPLRLIPFLNFCADRILLRKVGGGYIFIHRLLQEHFASLTPEDIERLAANAEGRHA